MMKYQTDLKFVAALMAIFGISEEVMMMIVLCLFGGVKVKKSSHFDTFGDADN